MAAQALAPIGRVRHTSWARRLPPDCSQVHFRDACEASIDVDQGNCGLHYAHLILSGRVGTLAERSEVIATSEVPGVTTVDATGLVVDPQLDIAARRNDQERSLAELRVRNAIRDALLDDPRVRSSDIAVDVDGTTAILGGWVNSLFAKEAAERVAHRVAGVAIVRNRLKVRRNVVREPSLTQNVLNAWIRDPYLGGYELAVQVVDGIAYLEGSVDSVFEKRRAQFVASRVDGVVDIVNYIDILPVADDDALVP